MAIDGQSEEGKRFWTWFIRKLDKHFLPKKNKDYARFQLGNLQQEDDESLAKYFARVRESAKKCKYHDENDAIRPRPLD